MRALVKSAVFEAAISVRRRFDRGRAPPLNYQCFPAQHAAGFRRQCEYLAKRCRVIPMSELGASLRDGRRLPAHAAVITVDDGHRDFYTCAYPILRDFGDVPSDRVSGRRMALVRPLPLHLRPVAPRSG
jgi:hypothetical protein